MISTLKDAVESMKAQDDKVIAELTVKCGAIWTQGSLIENDDLLNLAFFGDKAKTVVEQLPYFQAYNQMAAIDSAYKMLSDARDGLSSTLGSLYGHNAFGQTPKLSDAVWPALQHFVHFASAASMLVDSYRRFISHYDKARPQYNKLRLSLFTDPLLAKFTTDARNALMHGSVFDLIPTARYSFSPSGEAPEMTASLSIETSHIESLDWTAEARVFFKGKERIDIAGAVKLYFTSARWFKLVYLTELGFDSEIVYRQMVQLRSAARFQRFSSNLALVLQKAKASEFAIADFLDHAYTEEERTRIFSLLSDPNQQAKFILNLRDPLGLAKDALVKELAEVLSKKLQLTT